jgi:anthraniloyl-CoA monooxygenase
VTSPRFTARPIARSVACVGGGPAGLYLAILTKRADPSRRVTVFERNRADDTYGFGVIFSDATLETFARADAESFSAIRAASVHWDDLDVFVHGERVTSTGHGFAGLGRRRLLSILHERARGLGVELRFSEPAPIDALLDDYDLVVAADGVNSTTRERYAAVFQPSIDLRPNRFIWLGSTQPLSAFTFYFDRNEAGLFRVHAYRYAPGASTFIVECTAETFARTGLDPEDETGAIRYCETLFAHRLDGHRLLASRSTFRRFPTIVNRRWHDGKLVLLGDAAHTAHFSIGSGTKLAIDDAIALAEAIARADTLPGALDAYELERRPIVNRTQRAALTSLAWFEATERYFDRLDPLSFTYSLLTRSLRLDHDNLRRRDPALTARVDEAFARRNGAPASPPMFAPLILRGLVLPNRVGVAPMCQYQANDGVVGDWHLMHYGGLAIGGAGLVLTEMTAVSAEARITRGCAGLWDDDHITAWRKIVSFMHSEGRARVGVQLGHAGRKGSTYVAWEGRDRPLGQGWPLYAASPIPFRADGPVPIELDRAGMDRVRDDFVAATRRAFEAGFDLIELQMAHGHLLADFLSPLTNCRRDAYGGGLTARLSFPLEVLDAVRAAWPAYRPLAVRISASDWQDGGLSLEDAVEIARALAAHGCDIVDVSSGETTLEAKPAYGRLYQVPLSERIRLDADVPTMTSGAIATAGEVNTVLAGGRADLCLVGLGHLLDPYFTQRTAANEGRESFWPPPYQVLRGYRPRS